MVEEGNKTILGSIHYEGVKHIYKRFKPHIMDARQLTFSLLLTLFINKSKEHRDHKAAATENRTVNYRAMRVSVRDSIYTRLSAYRRQIHFHCLPFFQSRMPAGCLNKQRVHIPEGSSMTPIVPPYIKESSI